MGCASSKKALRDKAIAPLARSYSLPIHHPAQGKGDSHHVVALTSTTLGSLKLEEYTTHLIHQNLNSTTINNNSNELEGDKMIMKNSTHEEEEEDEDENDDQRSNLSPDVLLQAKAWSNKTEGNISQIPITPLLQTPPNEPDTINAWELMDGLEDSSPLRSFSFHAFSGMQINPETKREDDTCRTAESPKPVWLQFNAAAAEPVIADFDPEIISHFRKALDELSPTNNTCRALSPEPGPDNKRFSRIGLGTVQERIRVFQERIDHRTVANDSISKRCPPPPPPPSQGDQGRVVVYFTSLRGVRKTYEDCCDVRLIFRGYGVRVDERDVSMHQGFRDELYEILLGGGSTESSGCILPTVFVKGRYVGGAEEIRQMHESGELGKLIHGCETLILEEGGGACGGGAACEGCGDVRFVPCDRCFGSCKIFDEDEGVFLRCPDCNENGIICCPVCCCI